MSLIDDYERALNARNILELRVEMARRELRDLENALGNQHVTIQGILGNLNENDLSDFIECDIAEKALAEKEVRSYEEEED